MQRGSCCAGPPPCSATQNMARCGAHESLWRARNGGVVWGVERKRVQLDDRGLLGGAQLAASVLTAVKHKSLNMKGTQARVSVC